MSTRSPNHQIEKPNVDDNGCAAPSRMGTNKGNRLNHIQTCPIGSLRKKKQKKIEKKEEAATQQNRVFLYKLASGEAELQPDDGDAAGRDDDDTGLDDARELPGGDAELDEGKEAPGDDAEPATMESNGGARGCAAVKCKGNSPPNSAGNPHPKSPLIPLVTGTEVNEPQIKNREEKAKDSARSRLRVSMQPRSVNDAGLWQ
ncbi:hypothetical protein PIB30_087144 [Stylosanthes scabra]|uniref:Uncharacterized protein n=1 Tax=Stylosanthes scabra TaxID=79078 RepID=A0ABU6VVB5_9FABA|nr:hypothetical protein [Stylosanthes scabra]